MVTFHSVIAASWPQGQPNTAETSEVIQLHFLIVTILVTSSNGRWYLFCSELYFMKTLSLSQSLRTRLGIVPDVPPKTLDRVDRDTVALRLTENPCVCCNPQNLQAKSLPGPSERISSLYRTLPPCGTCDSILPVARYPRTRIYLSFWPMAPCPPSRPPRLRCGTGTVNRDFLCCPLSFSPLAAAPSLHLSLDVPLGHGRPYANVCHLSAVRAPRGLSS